MDCGGAPGVAGTNLVYPRGVVVWRTTDGPSPGVQPYSGITKGSYSQVVPAVAAGIQFKGMKKPNPPNLPTDPGTSQWEILIPGLNRGDVKERDVIIDDTSKRYLVLAAYWTPLNFQCRTELLEA